MTTHPTFCRICPVLCGLLVDVDGSQVTGVRGDPDHPITRGYCCPKGRALGDFHHHPARLDAPRLHGRTVDWPLLLDDLATSLRTIVDEHGADAVAVYYGTWSWMDAFGRLRTDALLRHLGTRSRYSAVTVDAIARLTVAEMIGGFGGLLPAIDVEAPGLTLLIGTNPIVSHGHASGIADPVTVLRSIAAGPGLWVIDPRRTESARLATRHLALRAGSDHALLAYVVRALLQRGADEEYIALHVSGIDELRAAVEPWTVERAGRATGLHPATIDGLVDAIRAAGRVTVATGTGTTMAPEGNVVEWLAWAVQIITGSFEQPGGAWFNPGAFVRLDEMRLATAPIDGAVAPGAPSRPELPSRFGERPCAALADEIEAGNVRALLVIGGDPLTSLPDTTRLEAAFRRLEVLAVADVIEADTVRLATHVLAVAGQLERDDINWFTDRFAPLVSAQRTDAVVAPAAERRTLLDIMQDLGEKLGLLRDEDPIGRRVSRLGLDSPGVIVADPPRPKGWVHAGALPEEGWRLAPPALVAQLAALPSDPPAGLRAIPRRAVRRMNSTLRDVRRGGDDTALWLNPADAGGLHDGQLAELRSAAGSITAPVRITADIAPGAVSVTHGLTQQNVNRLTSSAPGTVDPLTGMINQSGVPVTIKGA